MKRSTCAVSLLPLLAMTSAALAQSTEPAPAAPAAAAPKKEKKICRSEVNTGSIMVRSTCRTKAEWAAIDGANEQNTKNTLDNRWNTPGSPNGG